MFPNLKMYAGVQVMGVPRLTVFFRVLIKKIQALDAKVT